MTESLPWASSPTYHSFHLELRVQPSELEEDHSTYRLGVNWKKKKKKKSHLGVLIFKEKEKEKEVAPHSASPNVRLGLLGKYLWTETKWLRAA